MSILDYKDESILDATKEEYEKANLFERLLFRQRLFSFCVRNKIDANPYFDRFGLRTIKESKQE